MKVNEQTSLLTDTPYHCSPNQDERPSGSKISLLVIHGISLPPEQFGTGHVHDFFMNQLDIHYHDYFKQISELKVSCHIFIDRKGNAHQFVPFNKRAWHAGKSSHNGQSQCNDFSIGIELEGADHIPYTKDQYETLARCTRALIDYYGITLDDIKGHSDISPGRKSDPGQSFDWDYYFELLNSEA